MEAHTPKTQTFLLLQGSWVFFKIMIQLIFSYNGNSFKSSVVEELGLEFSCFNFNGLYAVGMKKIWGEFSGFPIPRFVLFLSYVLPMFLKLWLGLGALYYVCFCHLCWIVVIFSFVTICSGCVSSWYFYFWFLLVWYGETCTQNNIASLFKLSYISNLVQFRMLNEAFSNDKTGQNQISQHGNFASFWGKASNLCMLLVQDGCCCLVLNEGKRMCPFFSRLEMLN